MATDPLDDYIDAVGLALALPIEEELAARGESQSAGVAAAGAAGR